jgi:hypothetical protein
MFKKMLHPCCLQFLWLFPQTIQDQACTWLGPDLCRYNIPVLLVPEIDKNGAILEVYIVEDVYQIIFLDPLPLIGGLRVIFLPDQTFGRIKAVYRHCSSFTKALMGLVDGKSGSGMVNPS